MMAATMARRWLARALNRADTAWVRRTTRSIHADHVRKLADDHIPSWLAPLSTLGTSIEKMAYATVLFSFHTTFPGQYELVVQEAMPFVMLDDENEALDLLCEYCVFLYCPPAANTRRLAMRLNGAVGFALARGVVSYSGVAIVQAVLEDVRWRSLLTTASMQLIEACVSGGDAGRLTQRLTREWETARETLLQNGGRDLVESALQPGDLVLLKLEEELVGLDGDFNPVGVVLSPGMVSLRSGSGITRIAAARLVGRAIAVNMSGPFGDRIRRYFVSHANEDRCVAAGLNAFGFANERFFEREIMPPPRTYPTPEAYEERWASLLALARPGDPVFTYDASSMLSRFIASIDRGSWGHTATYIGDGKIVEADTGGVVCQDLAVYKNKDVHVGLYRDVRFDPAKGRAVADITLRNVGKRYGYLGAGLCGVRAALGVEGFPTPNGIVYSGRLWLVGDV